MVGTHQAIGKNEGGGEVCEADGKQEREGDSKMSRGWKEGCQNGLGKTKCVKSSEQVMQAEIDGIVVARTFLQFILSLAVANIFFFSSLSPRLLLVEECVSLHIRLIATHCDTYIPSSIISWCREDKIRVFSAQILVSVWLLFSNFYLRCTALWGTWIHTFFSSLLFMVCA